MEKIETINERTGQQYCVEHAESAEWIDFCISKDRWGKNARTIWKDQADEFELGRILVEREIEIVVKEAVLDEEGTEINPVETAFRTQIDLPADYTYQVSDCTYDYEEREARDKRRSEYPETGDFLDAFFKHYRDNDSTEINQWADTCEAIKLKYPKPVKP
jgi:hypothetical protein